MRRFTHGGIRAVGQDRVLQIITSLLLLLVLIVVGYPVIYILSCSFSSSAALSGGRVLLLPVDFSTASYEFVMQYKMVWIGYRNTLLYTVSGVIVTMTITILCAYPLSRQSLPGRSALTKYFLFTMLFSAGLIPNYIVRSKLGMVDTIWAVILAGALSFSNVAIMRTAFRSIPGELYDAARIDGANEAQILLRIMLPLTKATVSVIVLYSMVGCWNEYFNAMIYLRDSMKYPLQLILKTILTGAESLDMSTVDAGMASQANNGIEGIKYALIVISTVPVLVVYGIVQKYFEKGVMIGSVKG